MKTDRLYFPPEAVALVMRTEEFVCSSPLDAVDTEEWGETDYTL